MIRIGNIQNIRLSPARTHSRLPIVCNECIRHAGTDARQRSHQCEYLATRVAQCISTIERIINENRGFCHHHEITESQINYKNV